MPLGVRKANGCAIASQSPKFPKGRCKGGYFERSAMNVLRLLVIVLDARLSAMTIFAIVGITDPARLLMALNAHFASNYIQMPLLPEQIPSAAPVPFPVLPKTPAPIYFVASSPKVAATAKDVSDRLGITDGSNGNGVVLNVAGYFGRSNPQLWEWLAAKIQQVE